MELFAKFKSMYPNRQGKKSWFLGQLAKYRRSNPRCSRCGARGREHECPSNIRVHPNCSGEHNVFYCGCLIFKFKFVVAALRFKHDPTQKETRTEGRNFDSFMFPTPNFSVISYLRCLIRYDLSYSLFLCYNFIYHE